MRKGRFTEEQMVAIIREADREPVSTVAKQHGISEQTIYTWRKRDRRGRPYPLAARDRSVVASGERARRAGLPAQRQRSGVRFQGSAVLDCRAGHRHRINRARQALAEWRRRKLQRQVSRRMPQPRMVPLARRSEDHYRVLAPALQRGAAAFEPWLPHAKRICSSANKKPITSPCNGPGRCGIWASAPRPVAPPAHIGHIQQMGAVSS